MGRTINKLVIHHTASVMSIPQDVDSIREEHLRRGYSDIGYHKVILPNGEIKQGRDDHKQGAHCYSKYDKRSWGVNRTSLGISVVGNFELEEPTKEQLDAVKHACLVLCQRHDIPSSEIYGHRDFMATACPGKNLYKHMEEIRNYVENNR